MIQLTTNEMLNVEGMGATEHDKHYNQYPCKSILENLDQTINKKYVNNIPFETPFSELG